MSVVAVESFLVHLLSASLPVATVLTNFLGVHCRVKPCVLCTLFGVCASERAGQRFSGE